MDNRNLQLARTLVDARYYDAAQEALQNNQSTLRHLLAQRQCPEAGLPDCVIESLLHTLAQMDSNNFAFHIGAGEREGRVISALVRRRHFYLTHGIGRSGDLTVDQPKAAGSSLMSKLANILACDVIRQSGASSTQMAFVVPMATGMTLALVLRAVAQLREAEELERHAQTDRMRSDSLANCTAHSPGGNSVGPNQPRRIDTRDGDGSHCTGCEDRQGTLMSEESTCSNHDGRADRCGGGSNSTPSSSNTAALVQPRYVIWPRIDQKSALKCIMAAGLVPYPVELRPAPWLSQTEEKKKQHRQQQQRDTTDDAKMSSSHAATRPACRCCADGVCVCDGTVEDTYRRARTEARPTGNEEGTTRMHRDCAGTSRAGVSSGSACALCTMHRSHARHPYFLQAHVDDIERAIDVVGGAAAVVCILSTTSCFAPRLPDDVRAIAQLCARRHVGHVINNAYGLQSARIMQQINLAQKLGGGSGSSSRVDFVVQSTDKNFLVPVGGSVVSTPCARKGRAASALYAGRASAAPSLDVFVTALSLGRRGFRDLWSERYVRLASLRRRLRSFARARNEELIEEEMWGGCAGEVPRRAGGRRTGRDCAAAIGSAGCPCIGKDCDHYRKHDSDCDDNRCSNSDVNGCHDWSPNTVKQGEASLPVKRNNEALNPVALAIRNDISIAITMHGFDGEPGRAKEIGARLFRRGVTGPRVIVPDVCNRAEATEETMGTLAEVPKMTRVAGCVFGSYGSHTNAPVCAMLVLACGLGMTGEDEDGLMRRLDEVWPVDSPA